VARRIVITSGKGGVGKTTTAFLLGYNLARLGSKVIVLDMDIGLNNLDVVAGVDDEVNYDLCDVLEQKCRVRQALIRSEKSPQLYFLPCVNLVNSGKITAVLLQDVIKELNSSFDYILIDCPAGIGFEFRRAIFYANEALVVCTPHLISIRDAGRVCNLLCGCVDNVGLVVNRTRADLIAKSLMFSPQDIAQSLQIPLVGVVRENNSVNILASTTGGLDGLDERDMADWFELAKNVAENRCISAKNKKNSKKGEGIG